MAHDVETQENGSLNRTRLAALAALTWERFWPLALPAFGVLALFLAVSWLGLWPMMGDTWRIGLLALFGAVGLAALFPLGQMRLPTDAELDTRIERASSLEHRPVTAQSDALANDKPASNDPMALALWQEHRRRMAAQLTGLKPGTPVPQVAKRDPYALRALAVLLLFVGFAAGWGQWSNRVGDAFVSHAGIAAETGRVDAWITPPPYTNRPPLFLAATGTETDKPVTVPEGSTVVVRVLDMDQPSLALLRRNSEEAIVADTGEEKTAAKGDPASETFTFKLEETAAMVLRGKGQDRATWRFAVTPDENPQIEFSEAPTTSARGQLEFSYTVKDDYGVRGAVANLELAENLVQAGGSVSQKPADPLVEAPEINLPLPSQRAREGTAKTSQDLTAHPWAGARVSMTLTATDDAEQEGKSAPETFTLPQRVFVKPLAQALVYERRRLALDANQAKDVAGMLDIITTTHPDEFIKNVTHYTALRVIFRTVDRADSKEDLLEALDLMWETALAIEDGGLSQAERRLRDAQERLSKALEEGATDEEISELMKELREAMAEFMRELQNQMARNQQNQQAMPMDENTQVLRQQDLERMMQQIEDLAKSGSKDAARQLLQELQRMMNNLQTAQPSQQQQQQNDEFSRQMDKLGEMMRQQQQLMDETFQMQRQQQEMRRQQRQQGQQNQQGQRQQNQRRQGQQQQGQRQQQGQQQQGQQQQGQQQQGQQGEQQGQRPMTADELADAMRQLQERQGELQRQMQEMQQAMRELGMEPGKLGEAGEAMGQAESELGQGQTGPATGEQGRALQAMREGAQQMMQNMQNQAGEQGRQGERGQHGEQTRNDRDPLGRNTRSQGPQIGQDTKVPGEIDAQRAREILDAIRRRLGETTRPKLELDYLDRLLPTR
ncbi:MAG: TIGR02302 family protein [Pseudomonadota bacterium]